MLRGAPALVLAGVALELPGAASADVLIGCKNKTNGNVRVVADAALCNVSEIAIFWNAVGEQGPAGPAGPAVAGIVSSDGSVIVGVGFAAVRLGLGRYQVQFPPGTWTAFPVMTVSPFGVSGAIGNPVVAAIVGFGDGSATFNINMSSTSPVDTPFDNAFTFIAVQIE